MSRYAVYDSWKERIVTELSHIPTDEEVTRIIQANNLFFSENEDLKISDSSDVKIMLIVEDKSVDNEPDARLYYLREEVGACPTSE